jgi:cobalamin biosynthesis Mg chelatase CobN
VVSAGGKTFFQRQGILVDSAFDPDAGEPEVIPFASDAYFDLLSDYPESGQYLALAEEILVVLGEQAYRITADSEEPTMNSEESTVNSEQSTEDSEQSTEDSGQAAGNSQSGTPPAQSDQPAAGMPICGAALAMPLLVVGLFGINLTRRRRM